MRPTTKTTVVSSLKKFATMEDGTSLMVLSGIAVGGQFALGDLVGPFLQLSDAEAKGIDAAYDTTNSTVAHKHIKDFYEETEALGIIGVKLYVMVVAMTQTLTQTCTAATANGYKKGIDAADGLIRLVGLTFTPSGSYTPTYVDEMEADLWTALAALKITAEAHRVAKDPYRCIVEGRNFQGTFASIKDMRSSGTTPGVNRAMVVIGNDWDYSGGVAGVKSKYASVGKLLGRAAAMKVNRNIGRVASGSVPNLAKASLSNGALISATSSTNLDLLHDRGFVFFTKHKRKSGFFWNDDPMACVSTDGFSQLSIGRMIDKVDVITHTTNIEQILNEIEVDPNTGQLDAAAASHLEGELEDAVNAQMGGTAKEISGVKVTIDPAQSIITTSLLVQEEKVVPTGTLRNIETTIVLSSSL